MAFRGTREASTPLHKAARHGNEADVDRMLSDGADVAAEDGEGRTALHLAVMRGHTRIIRKLLQQGGDRVLLSRDILGCTPVHLAAVQNQVRLVLLLVDPLLEDHGGQTLIHELAKRGCLQDLMSFLHLGWDVASSSRLSSESLKGGGASGSSVAKMSQILGWTDLHHAAMEGRLSSIKKSVESCSFDVHISSANSWTPLHYAAAYNQVEVIDFLVRMGGKINCQNSAGLTPLHVACSEGHIPAVQKLIDLGCDLLVKDLDGCTPLYCAVTWNQIEVVRYIHSLGCPLCIEREESSSALHIAAEQGWVELIEVLIKELGSTVDCRDAYDLTPLHSAANWGWIDAIRKLVELAHDVDVKDCLGRTPLHYAALHGRAEAIEELFKLGADLQQIDERDGSTPLHLAADAGQCEALAILVELGADLEVRTSKGLTCLQLAIMKGPANVDVLALLLDLGSDIAVVADSGSLETPLHVAARAGHLDLVQKLISCGANAYGKTKDGSTPLHYAAAFGQAYIVDELVKAGNNVEPLDNALNTPLHLAAACGFLDSVLTLVQLGGSLNCRDMSDCTPLQNAALGTYSAFAEVSPEISQCPNEHLQGMESLSLRRSGLSPALLPGEVPGKSDGGMVPVRTGFAWATLGRPNYSWKGTELMNLLRRVTRSRNLGGLLNSYNLVQNGKLDDLSKGTNSLTAWGHCDFLDDREGLELLLKKTEAFHLEHMEQDRSRLLPVAEALIQMGADASAVDNEGRTALHLAAGCGDKAMVVKLAELGLDVNCKDAVGGTPMHHAAMANKKEVMFALARLGTDWRVKAEGIEGATASFVLCGQHGKSARQQKLLEAKLKRVYCEGEAAKRSGKSILSTTINSEEEYKHGGDLDELVERAEANMAALLEEEAKSTTSGRARKKKNRRRGKQPDSLTDDAVCTVNAVSVCREAIRNSDLESSKSPSKASQPRANSLLLDSMHTEKCSLGAYENGSYQAVRVFLDEALMCASTVLEIGAATGGEAMQDVLGKLDTALQQAHKAGMPTKHARRVRNCLEALLNDSTYSTHSSEMHELNGKAPPGTGLLCSSKMLKRLNGNEGSENNECAKVEPSNHGHQDSEWKQVGSHGKKNGGAAIIPKHFQGSRTSSSPSLRCNRRLHHVMRAEAQTTKSNTIAVANGSVVVRTGNVVVVKTVATSSKSKKSASGKHGLRQLSPTSSPASKPAKPAWKQGCKLKPTSDLSVASDTDFPPLQASTSVQSANQEASTPAGEAQAFGPSVSGSDKEKSTTQAENCLQPDSKPYELFGGPLPAPVGLSLTLPYSQCPYGFAWGPFPKASSHMCRLEAHQTIGCVSNGGLDPSECNHSPDLSRSFFGSHIDRNDSKGIPIPLPTNPFAQQGPYYSGSSVDEVQDHQSGHSCVWQPPAPFVQPVGYMPLMSSSFGIQTMNGVAGPYGLLPHVSNMVNLSSSYDSMLQSHRLQPPPPPGPPPQMQAAFPVYDHGHSVASGDIDGGTGIDFHDRLIAEDSFQTGEVLEHLELLTVEESSEAPLSVSRHLLGELEAEIGI